MSEQNYSGKTRCGHCGNEAPMEIGATLSQVKKHEDPETDFSWDAGPAHELMICPACQGVTLRRVDWHDGEPDDMEVVYPVGVLTAPIGLPPAILKEFEAARSVRSVNPNAYGLLLDRLLGAICDERGVKKGKRDARLKELSTRGEIPDRLVEVAKKLQELRHMGAYARVGELSPAEVPILDSLCRAILEYVYSAPYLVKHAEEHLNHLREQERKKKKGKGRQVA